MVHICLLKILEQGRLKPGKFVFYTFPRAADGQVIAKNQAHFQGVWGVRKSLLPLPTRHKGPLYRRKLFSTL